MEKEKNFYYVPQDLIIRVKDEAIFQTEIMTSYWERNINKDALNKLAEVLGRPELIDTLCEPSISFKSELNNNGQLVLIMKSWSGGLKTTHEQVMKLSDDETISELFTAIDENNTALTSLTQPLVERGFKISQYRSGDHLIYEISHPDGIVSTEVDLAMEE